MLSLSSPLLSPQTLSLLLPPRAFSTPPPEPEPPNRGPRRSSAVRLRDQARRRVPPGFAEAQDRHHRVRKLRAVPGKGLRPAGPRGPRPLALRPLPPRRNPRRRLLLRTDDLCEEHPEVILLCTSIISTEAVLRSLPLSRLKRSTLFADVLSVKEFPKSLMAHLLPKDFDIVCTHPMFGPESAKSGWIGFEYFWVFLFFSVIYIVLGTLFP